MLTKVVEKLEVFLLDDGFYAFLVGQQTESFWAETLGILLLLPLQLSIANFSHFLFNMMLKELRALVVQKGNILRDQRVQKWANIDTSVN